MPKTKSIQLKETKRLLKVVHELRTQCPWDKKQTHKTLVPYLLEEAYETVDAIDSRDFGSLEEELGDVLLQVALHAEIAGEGKKFDFESIARGIADKMIHRHPHIYKQTKAADLKTHLANWTRLKNAEKPKRYLLEGVPKAMPALQLAQRYGEIASSVSFDWKEAAQVMEKVDEELAELKSELAAKKLAKAKVEMELGDLLFTLTSLARHLKLDAETALRKSSAKFAGRLTRVEDQVRKAGKKISDCSPEDLESHWESAKVPLSQRAQKVRVT